MGTITGSQTRAALVCGGSSGIGYASAARLVADGMDVMLLGRDAGRLEAAAEALRRDATGRVEWVCADVSAPEAAEEALAAVEKTFGRLDVLVLTTGGPPPGRILGVDDAAWHTAAELLLFGPLRFVRACVPLLSQGGEGRVVVITSTVVQRPQPDLAASVVLRSAMTSAAGLLAQECAADGVTVNCVAPGATDTDRRRQILSSRAAATGTSAEDAERADVAAIPAGRAGRPEEVAAAVAFLASEQAGYITGTVLAVDGGRTGAS